MRSQFVITIDTEVNRRNKGETVQAFAVRMDEALTRRINEWQKKPAYQNWDLLSVSPAGFNAVGFFTTLWEYDPELHEDAKTEGDDRVHDVKAEGEWYREQKEQEYIGNNPVHDVKVGDILCINGVNFKLTHFGQDYKKAAAALTPLKEVMQQEAPMANRDGRVGRDYSVGYPGGVRYNRPFRG